MKDKEIHVGDTVFATVGLNLVEAEVVKEIPPTGRRKHRRYELRRKGDKQPLSELMTADTLRPDYRRFYRSTMRRGPVSTRRTIPSDQPSNRPDQTVHH